MPRPDHAPRKRSISIAGHRTSISVEAQFWQALHEIATIESRTVSAVIAEVDRARPPHSNLSSAVRLHILNWYRKRTGVDSARGLRV